MIDYESLENPDPYYLKDPIYRWSRRIHSKLNPNFGPNYQTSLSGIRAPSFGERMFLLLAYPQSPLHVVGRSALQVQVTRAVLEPSASVNVTDEGGAEVYSVQPSLGIFN